MTFFRGAWRVLVGVKDALALLFLLLFFGACFTLLSISPNPGDARGGALLLDLDGVIVEQPEESDPLALLAGGVAQFGQYRARDVIHALDTAAKDDGIKAVVLNLDGFLGGGQVVLQDVAEALDRVRAANKPVLAYATGYSDDGYLLAAHASEIWLNPMGSVAFAGPGGNQLYYKGLFDRLGVNIHVYRVGKFKSFVEPYTLAGQSDEARAAQQALADALWSDWQAHVGKARPKANFAAILADPAAAATDGDLANTSLRLGLVDKLGDETAFARRIATLTGSNANLGPADFNRSDLDGYLAVNPVGVGGGSVGIVTIAGNIVDGEAPGGSAGGDTIERLIHRAASDDGIKALVVRVDSGGGSALAAEKMRAALDTVRARGKPVVVSLGNIAASGGYWVALGGDRVFAEPATVTGSIGVFGIIPTFERTLAQYGVTSDGVRTTPLSGQPDILAGTTPELDRLIQAGIESTYRRFVNLVAAKRGMTPARADEIAQGRVWDGGSARQLGLVDAFGSLDEAVAEAAKRAKIDADDVRRVWIEEQPDFLTWLLKGVGVEAQRPSPGAIASLVRAREGRIAAEIRDAMAVMSGPVVQARCLACPPPPAAVPARSRLLSIFDRIFG